MGSADIISKLYEADNTVGNQSHGNDHWPRPR